MLINCSNIHKIWYEGPTNGVYGLLRIAGKVLGLSW